MAYKKKEIKKLCVLLFLAVVISQVTFISAINSDCKGKAFYCLNSTHFMICLDLGDGVSTTVEDFIIPCPPPTICIETNAFECEYHTTTTPKPILQSEVPVTVLNAQTWRDDSDFTTFLPFRYSEEDSVKSEKYYDILDDQLATRETLPETSTHQESTTETKINDEINIERTTFTQEDKSTLPPTFYTITDDVTISSQQVKVVVNNDASGGYDNHFDTVSTTTLSESTTQTTTRYDETQPTTGYIDEHISSNNIIITKEEPPILNFYTYQEEATTSAPLNLDFWPDGITQTTNFALDKLTTTVQETENEEIKGTTNREISYSLTTDIDKYLNTYSDYADTFSPITAFQEAGEMPNEVTNTNRNYEITTELNNYINNNKFDTTTPSVTLQQENRIVKDVFMTNITDASNTEDYVYNNSIPKITEEDTTINYGKTEDTAIDHSNTIDTNINYPTTTDIHEYINNIVSTTKENIINDEYEAKYFPKSTTSIDESSFIGIKYMTRPYVSQIFNNDVNQITYKEEENTHSSGFPPKANINVILKNTQDITTSTDVSYGDLMVNEMSSQTDKKFSEIKQTTSKVQVTGYIMQDNTSPYNPKGTIHNDEQQSVENITVFNDIVSSSTNDDSKEINFESTDPLDQISTDSSLLSPIEAPSIIKDNLIVPILSALDNVTEIKINDTVFTERYNDHNTKQSNYKNQDKTNPNFYTTFTQSNALTSSSPGYDYKSNIKTTLPDLEDPKTTSSELISDLKTMDTYIKETTISEQRNTDVYTFSIEDRTKTTEFTTSPWLNNAESNNNQYEITKEMNVIYHDKIPDTASTTPTIFDLNNLEKVTIDDKNNLEKTVTKPSTEMKSTLSISQDGSSVNNLFTFINDMFTTSYVNATDSYALSNFQDNGITESADYIQESKPTNKTKYEDKHYSFVGNTYPMVNKWPDNIPDITTETIHKLSMRVPSVPIINGTKTVVRYSEDSKIEGAGDAIKLPAMEVNNTNATRNKTVVVSHSTKTLNSSQLNSKVPVISIASNINNAAEMKSPSIALAHNISLDRHETIGKKQSVFPNIQEKKETVSVQISQPCNKTIPDTTNRSNRTSPTITSEQLNLTCLNRYSGKYPDQYNCQTFYMCIGTMSPIVGHCPQNSVFSDILNQCTRNLSHCVRNNEFQCVSPGRFSDLWSRDTYYICVRHKSKFVRFKLRCQKGYFLNRTSITCVEDPVIEKQSFTLESYSTSSSSSSSDSKSGQIESNTNVEFKCEKEGVFPDPNHCRKYYVCKKISKSQIRLKKKKCDSDEVFNKKKKKCVDEDSYECET
ncbi:unnamed protein product [Pieris macdunnoughi]|uniref:Chitin-binding type-2 domain-containing protein n=1 Tax=Pieris macdunnoughi TaxID=345717 RepID=A0A821SD90_9NEOP|nr:unnamed protein product [Pieris macdunnoughi]